MFLETFFGKKILIYFYLQKKTGIKINDTS